MKFKKIIALSLATISVLSMAACGGGSSDKESKEAKKDGDTIEINFFPPVAKRSEELYV